MTVPLTLKITRVRRIKNTIALPNPNLVAISFSFNDSTIVSSSALNSKPF